MMTFGKLIELHNRAISLMAMANKRERPSLCEVYARTALEEYFSMIETMLVPTMLLVDKREEKKREEKR